MLPFRDTSPWVPGEARRRRRAARHRWAPGHSEEALRMTRSPYKNTLLIAAVALGAAPARATPKPLVNYFQPIPIVGKLSTTVWGASTVGARDPESGLEDNGPNGGVGPQQ